MSEEYTIMSISPADQVKSVLGADEEPEVETKPKAIEVKKEVEDPDEAKTPEIEIVEVKKTNTSTKKRSNPKVNTTFSTYDKIVAGLPKKLANGKTITYLDANRALVQNNTQKMTALPLKQPVVFNNWKQVNSNFGPQFIMYVDYTLTSTSTASKSKSSTSRNTPASESNVSLSASTTSASTTATATSSSNNACSCANAYWSNSRAAGILSSGIVDSAKHYLVITRTGANEFAYGTINK